MPTNQPTVLVKKADGTFARMTLEEIKKMRSGASATAVIPTKPAGRVEESLAVQTLRDPSTPLRSAQDDNATKPVPEQILPRQKAGQDDKQRGKDDSVRKPLVSQPRANQVEDVLKKLKFRVPEQLQNRLRSIIQLRLKDIRSVEQTKDKVIQPVNQGGLGLSEVEAGELVSVCGIILDRETKNAVVHDVPALKKKNLLPMVEPEEIPAVATPFNAFVHGEQKKAPVKISQNPSPRPLPPPKAGRHEEGTLRPENDKNGVLSFKPATKVVMEDVQAPRPVEMGPVEEIQYMTLVDFRRLSAKPIEAAARLKQKFLNLRDESVLLYLDALSAWHKSPLYMDYMKNVSRALKTKRKITALEGNDANQIKLEEILAIVNMEKELE